MTIIDRIRRPALEAMLAQAEEEWPRECCGLLIVPEGSPHDLLSYRPCNNLHQGEAGEDTFALDPACWARVEDQGEIVAVVHSHPNASANPSMADRVQCEKSGYPWVIVGWPSRALVELQPTGWQAPFEGREFHHGVLDCYTLVQDWYRRQAGIELPDFEREDAWWEPGPNQKNLYREGLLAAGFAEVPLAELQPGDGLLMRVMSPDVDNHAAVYLGDGMMLHHLYGQLSRVEWWDHPWQRRTTAAVRHKDWPRDFKGAVK